jgi:hypothetical protein
MLIDLYVHIPIYSLRISLLRIRGHMQEWHRAELPLPVQGGIQQRS